MSDQTHHAGAGVQGNSAARVTNVDPYDVPTTLATGKVIFGWALVGIPLLYGVITTLSKVGQLFG
ncbi:hypothetical protein CQ018_09195 [Arthrobacter sp. MYb227]|uniref:MFS transporter small subunit n=1 Tax=Arthrobacter sp. MYb227 TaxID=1848601 RepID=UPI000CFD84C7|nr:hypothetical protein [Arthrobacter sp. MYb227]PQZ93814.1 hypothetical protein CQ018_09195 [Arthrobacter sp. MYb227]